LAVIFAEDGHFWLKQDGKGAIGISGNGNWESILPPSPIRENGNLPKLGPFLCCAIFAYLFGVVSRSILSTAKWGRKDELMEGGRTADPSSRHIPVFEVASPNHIFLKHWHIIFRV
jgi:hypothetical protein